MWKHNYTGRPISLWLLTCVTILYGENIKFEESLPPPTQEDTAVPSRTRFDDLNLNSQVHDLLEPLFHSSQLSPSNLGERYKDTLNLPHILKSEVCDHKRTKRSTEYNEQVTVDFANDRFVYESGHVAFGGLFSLFRRENDLPCQKLFPVAAMWVESMLYAVDKVNNDPSLLPDMTLGCEVRDDCSDINKVLKLGLQFVDNAGPDGSCNDKNPHTIGLVGTGSSVTSSSIAQLLSLFKIPQVSYAASSSIFSDKTEYPYFLRTVGSDANQANALADMATHFKWNYVALIYSDDSYGLPGMEALLSKFQTRGVCAVVWFSISVDTSEEELLMNIQRIKEDQKIEVIFTFCTKSQIIRVLAAAEKAELFDRTWIATDTWANSLHVVDGKEDVVKGMLGVFPKANLDPGFEKHLTSIDPFTYTRNPWYQDALETLNGCTFNKSNPLMVPCTGQESFLAYLESSSDGLWSSLIIDAVYALAHGLHDFIVDCEEPACQNTTNFSNFDGESYLGYVRNVTFHGFSNANFSFDDKGDPLTKYFIFNLQNKSGSHIPVSVGEWGIEKGFEMYDEIVWRTGDLSPVSRCSADCQPGSYLIKEQLTCCWHCVTCSESTVSSEINSERCIMCNVTHHPSMNNSECLAKHVDYQTWSQMSSIILLALAVIGILLSLFIFVMYIKFRDTPVIKATSTELSQMCIVGIAVCFTCIFFFTAKPTDFLCKIQFFSLGVSLSILVGALLMKTNRISRIFNRKLADGRPSIFLQIKFQILFVLFFALGQTVLNVINLVVYPSRAAITYSKYTGVLECQNDENVSFELITTIGYNFVLAMICNYQAFRIRKLPGQFNDSVPIFFTMLSFCFSCFIFLVIYFTTMSVLQSVGLSLAILLVGYTGLVLLFAPKLWVVLLHPEANVHQSTFESTLKNSPASSEEINRMPELNGSYITHDTTDAVQDVVNNFQDSGNNSDSESIASDEDDGDEDAESFLEEVEKLEKVLQKVALERNEAIENLEQLKQNLWDLEERHGEDMKRMNELCEKERDQVMDILEQDGYSKEEISQKLEEITSERELSPSDNNETTDNFQELLEAAEKECRRLHNDSERFEKERLKYNEKFFMDIQNCNVRQRKKNVCYINTAFNVQDPDDVFQS